MAANAENKRIVAALIAATGKRTCSNCRQQRDATTGTTYTDARGMKRWRCCNCAAVRAQRTKR